MSCFLRISGETLDIDTLLSKHSLVADRFWKKGEPHTLKGKLHSNSGATFVASDADFDEFDRQVSEATEFLALHAPAISEMSTFPGVQYAMLDFGVSFYEGCFAQNSYLPPRLIQLAASAQIGIEISHYACNDDEDS
ncbi:MAG: hypothetical protein OEV42_04835 [Deltaproteobacteria bacterium]|nr:hypothetical protein [Deltaproteobacteria bacterium]